MFAYIASRLDNTSDVCAFKYTDQIERFHFNTGQGVYKKCTPFQIQINRNLF
jgi:hypothetical protein